MRVVVWIVAIVLGCGGPKERRARPGHACAAGEWGVAHYGPIQSSYHPPTYTCVRCASREDVVVALGVPADRPPVGVPDDPARWRCKQRCYADYQCAAGRCISGWMDPHCDELGRSVIVDGDALGR